LYTQKNKTIKLGEEMQLNKIITIKYTQLIFGEHNILSRTLS